LDFIKQIIAKPLFKATSLNGISLLIKFMIGFITSKLIAIFVGPSGMALVGNLRNFLSTTEAVATLGFENGLVKYVAEQKDQKEQLKQTLSTVFLTVFVVCGISSLILFLFSGYFNGVVFGTQFHYDFVFKILALALPFYVGNVFLIATINGLGQFKKVIYVNIIGSCIGLLVSILLIYNLKIDGALLSIILTPSLLFLASFAFINQEIEIAKSIRTSFYRLSFLRNLSSYSLMALFSATAGPMIYLAIRKYVIASVGIEQAGFYEAMNKISSYDLLFVTTIVTVYFLPKLATAQTIQETKSLFWNYYKGILPVFTLGLIVIYFLKDFIVRILLTPEFLPVSNLFFWQLLGDLFKAASFILGTQFYAKKLTRDYLITEALSFVILYFSSIYLVSIFKTEGVVMAYALTYFMYLLVLTVYFRKSLF